MADTSSVPVSEPMSTIKSPGASVYSANVGGTAYNSSRGLKGQRVHHLLNFLLRLLAAMATAAALTTMIKSNESAMGRRSLGGKWTDFTAFKWFVLANAIVCAYTALTAHASLFGVCFRAGPLSLAPLTWLTFLLDLLLASALMSAAVAATTITWIEHRGESTAGWPSTCGTLRGYCKRVVGALIASYVGWVLFTLSTISAATAIHRVQRRAAY